LEWANGLWKKKIGWNENLEITIMWKY